MNNIVNAISIGLTSGVTLSLVLARAEVGFFKSKVQSEDLSHGLQALSVGTKCPFVFIFVFVSGENMPSNATYKPTRSAN